MYTASIVESIEDTQVGERYQSAIDDIGHMFQSGMVTMLTCAFLCVPVAIIVGFVRLAVFLRMGTAPSSACETVAFFSQFNPFNCVVKTDWLGFNQIVTWLLLGVDASLGFVVLSVTFVLLAIACILLGKVATAMGAR